MPWSYLVHLVCEVFHVLPSQAEQELERDTGLLWQVMDVKAFCAAHQDYTLWERRARDNPKADRPVGMMADRVTQARYARLARAKERRDGLGERR